MSLKSTLLRKSIKTWGLKNVFKKSVIFFVKKTTIIDDTIFKKKFNSKEMLISLFSDIKKPRKVRQECKLLHWLL